MTNDLQISREFLQEILEHTIALMHNYNQDGSDICCEYCGSVENSKGDMKHSTECAGIAIQKKIQSLLES